MGSELTKGRDKTDIRRTGYLKFSNRILDLPDTQPPGYSSNRISLRGRLSGFIFGQMSGIRLDIWPGIRPSTNIR